QALAPVAIRRVGGNRRQVGLRHVHPSHGSDMPTATHGKQSRQLAAALERPAEGQFVGIFEVAAHGEAAGNPRDPHR
ncbi:MAG: hypothetical protein QOK39_1123, partial [Acidimicrobiaceae bacterium]|nr:hypothetical protein [Acidimicrobiaceae bacterium]